MPEELFSIVDKVNIWQGAGFKKLLVDFSKTKVSKSQIKAIMTSLVKQQPLPEISRFNWKDGFYNPEKLEEYKAAAERAAAAKAKGAVPARSPSSRGAPAKGRPGAKFKGRKKR